MSQIRKTPPRHREPLRSGYFLDTRADIIAICTYMYRRQRGNTYPAHATAQEGGGNYETRALSVTQF